MADAQKGKGEDDAAGFEALEQDYQGVRHRVPPPSCYGSLIVSLIS